jgi:hypothetical protein
MVIKVTRSSFFGLVVKDQKSSAGIRVAVGRRHSWIRFFRVS